MQIQLSVNGEKHEADVEPRLLLVHLLRENLRLTGTHIGCDTTHCGACTVLMDGRAGEVVHGVRGAGQRQAAHDRRGPGAGRHAPSAAGRLHGRARAAVRLLHAGHADDQLRVPRRRTPSPSEDDIRWAISGNLCRCTGYVNIVKAVQHAAASARAGRRVMAPQDDRPKSAAWATRMKRKEDPRFIRGKGTYVDDVKLPGMLYLDIVRSPYAHAKIVKIDASEGAGACPACWRSSPARTWPSTTCTGCRRSCRTPRWCCRSRRSCTRRRKSPPCSPPVATPPPTARPWWRSSTSRCRWSSIPQKALEPGAPVLRTDKKDKKDNHIWHWEWGDRAATDRAFAEAASPSRRTSTSRASTWPRSRRAAASPTSTRSTGKLTVWMTTQAPHAHPHGVRAGGRPRRPGRAQDPDHLARHRRRLRRQGAGLSRLRDRGGRLGAHRQAGEVDRGPHGEPPGRLASRATITSPPSWRRARTARSPRCASRRWPTTATPTPRANPSKFPAGLFHVCTGSYDLKAAHVEVDGVYTNKPPGGIAYRCSFRVTEAVHTIERMVDIMAHELEGRPGRVPDEELHQAGAVPLQVGARAGSTTAATTRARCRRPWT